MRIIESKEFAQLLAGLDEMGAFLKEQRSILKEPRDVGSVQTHMYKAALTALVKDAHVLASMASQLLEESQLNPTQMILLKGTLSRLEFELRLAKDA